MEKLSTWNLSEQILVHLPSKDKECSALVVLNEIIVGTVPQTAANTCSDDLLMWNNPGPN